MENRFERATKATVGVGVGVGAEHSADRLVETKKEWLAPELRKAEVAKITANHIVTNFDGSTTS